MINIFISSISSNIIFLLLLYVDPACADDQDGLGRTALTYAVHYQQMSALHCLLENEANPNVTAHGKSECQGPRLKNFFHAQLS